MPRWVGFEPSDFNAEQYRQSVGENHGAALTTEGVREGIADITREYDKDPKNHWLTAIKETPAYLTKVKTA